VDITLIAPGLAFVVVLLFGTGVYRTVNQGGLLARRRIASFAPGNAARVESGPMADSPLFKKQRYSSIGLLDALLGQKGRGAAMSMELARAGLPLLAGEYLLIRWGAALLALVVVKGVSQSLPVALVTAVASFFIPLLYVKRRQAKRAQQFDDQLVDALVLIANSLKSGYSFMQGMEAVAREMPDPIGVEFEEALREIRMGGAVEEALTNISKRVRSADFELVVTAMVIQRQVGGNMTEILSNIAYTVRERHRILREVRVLTAQERMSGYIVACLPVFLVVGLSIISPKYIQGMWLDPSGKLILAAGFVMALAGLLVMRKIVEIDV